MLPSALEIIQEIQDRANKEIAAIKAEAVSEVVKNISETKTLLADYQKQYESLTGKTVTGEKAPRVRLSPDQIAALVVKVESIIKAAKDGISMGDIVQKAGASASAVRKAVKSLKGIKTTGNKATTLYHAK
jgi:hypothetical protein